MKGDEVIHFLVDVGKFAEDLLGEAEHFITPRNEPLYHAGSKQPDLKRMAYKWFGRRFHLSIAEFSSFQALLQKYISWNRLDVMLMESTTKMPSGSTPNSRQSFKFSESVNINYEVHGNAGQTILLLHGFGASLESWRDIEPWLQRHSRLYLVDLKGFGLSSKPHDGAYSLEDQAGMVISFIEANDLNDLAVIGHSYGGAVALLTYLKLKEVGHEGRIHSLILLDSAAYPQSFPFFISILRVPIINWMTLNLVPASWLAKFTLAKIFHDPSKVQSERIDRYARFFDLPGSHHALVQSAKQIVPHNVAAFVEGVAGIRARTLIVWGENDPVVPLAHAHRFHHDIEASRLQIIPKCGHVPHEENPDRTAQFILEFLS